MLQEAEGSFNPPARVIKNLHHISIDFIIRKICNEILIRTICKFYSNNAKSYRILFCRTGRNEIKLCITMM